MFIGITMALAIGATGRKSRQESGLGAVGAIVINACGGGVLALLLIFGSLGLSIRGTILLWGLVIALAGISVAEIIVSRRSRKDE